MFYTFTGAGLHRTTRQQPRLPAVIRDKTELREMLTLPGAEVDWPRTEQESFLGAAVQELLRSL